jgi:hypothetical protein
MEGAALAKPRACHCESPIARGAKFRGRNKRASLSVIRARPGIQCLLLASVLLHVGYEAKGQKTSGECHMLRLRFSRTHSRTLRSQAVCFNCKLVSTK